MAWFKLVNLFLHAVHQWVSERAKYCDQLASPLGRNNISQNRGAVCHWVYVQEEYKIFSRRSREGPRSLQLWGGWGLPGHTPLTDTRLKEQHFQLLCHNELNRFVPSSPQVGVQQEDRGEAIPSTCWWWSPGREGGGKPNLSSLRTSATQFSDASHGGDVTESLSGTGTHYLLWSSKNPKKVSSRGATSCREHLTVYCMWSPDETSQAWSPKSYPEWEMSMALHGCVSLNFCLWIPII